MPGIALSSTRGEGPARPTKAPTASHQTPGLSSQETREQASNLALVQIFFLHGSHLGPPRSTWVTHGVEAVQPPPVSTGQDMPQLNVREKLTQAQKEAIVESISRLLNHSEIFHSIPAP